MAIWTIANQKGGVGKTTSAVSLAGALATRGRPTLMVDLDPHGSLSAYFGRDPDAMEHSVYQVFAGQADSTQLIQRTRFDNLSLLPASSALATLDRQLGSRDGMGLVLARYLRAREAEYAHILVDCPPVLGVLLVNALAACDQLIIPVQTEFLALKGLERMLHTLGMIVRARKLELPYTIVPVMYDKRTRAAQDCLGMLKERYAPHLWPGVVPVDTQFREASRAGVPVTLHAPQARGARAYESLLGYLCGEPHTGLPEEAVA